MGQNLKDNPTSYSSLLECSKINMQKIGKKNRIEMKVNHNSLFLIWKDASNISILKLLYDNNNYYEYRFKSIFFFIIIDK